MEKSPQLSSSSTNGNGCLGCRSFFREGQQLQLQDLRVEFKNFTDIPLREAKHKYTLLKTINAFINTKGGSIFIGVEDSDCKVKGYYLSMKQQDEFKFFVKGLVEKMHPPIDFSNREEVTTVFLPVMNTDKFTGRYIVKIVVRQGHRDRVYTFHEKIRLMNVDKTEFEDFELRYAYKRVGPGGIQKLDPLALLDEVYRKAKSPNEEEKSHEGCHPRPLEPTYSLKNVGFSGLYSRVLREKIIQKFNAQLQKRPMQCDINYDQDTRVLLVEFEKEEDAEKIKNLLNEHLEVLMSEDIELEYVGAELGTYLFRNKKKLSKKDEEKSRDKSISPSKEAYDQISKEPPVKSNFKKEKGQQSPHLSPASGPSLPPQPLNYQIQPKTSRIGDGLYYVITHININLRDKLIQYLTAIFQRPTLKFEILVNSILICCDSSQQFEEIRQLVLKNDKQLQMYGHNGIIVYGETTGHLCIYNYTERSRGELKQYVQRLMGPRLISSEFKKDNKDKARSYLDLKMDPKDAANYLDILLKDGELRSFRLKGDSRDTPKMKVMLKCNNS